MGRNTPRDDTEGVGQSSSQEFFTRGVVFTLDPNPAQERLLRNYAGAARFAYNWTIGAVSANLTQRRAEGMSGTAEEAVTPTLSWSAYGLGIAWNAAKAEVAPWWQEVSMHAFRSGTAAAAAALKNFGDSKSGRRKGRDVGFPKPKSRRRSTLSVSFVEINHQLSRLAPDRHHVRLMLPQSSPDPEVRRRRQHLSWIHTVESTRRLYKLVEGRRAKIQKVTISLRGGRWQVAFSVRYEIPPTARTVTTSGRTRLVGVDAGLRHLATLSIPFTGLSDAEGHIENPALLVSHMRRLRKLDRAIARCRGASKNRARLIKRRARLHSRIAKSRRLKLHRITGQLVRHFGNIAIEDLGVLAMSSRKGRLGRSMADASLGELRRQLTYKTADLGSALIVVDRFFPSSKTCSSCGSVKAKLDRKAVIFECDTCGAFVDRDVNAARNIAQEARRLIGERDTPVAGLRPETQNADPRPRKTRGAQALKAAVAA
jgi:putative transposase